MLTKGKRTRARNSAMPYLNGKTTVVRAGPTQAVRLARRARPAKGVARSNKVLMRRMIPTYAASIGMMTLIRPHAERKRAPGTGRPQTAACRPRRSARDVDTPGAPLERGSRVMA